MNNYLDMLRKAKSSHGDLAYYYTDSAVKLAWLETIIREKLERTIYDYCSGEYYSSEICFTLNFLKTDKSDFTVEDVYNILCTCGLNECTINITKTIEPLNDEYTFTISFEI